MHTVPAISDSVEHVSIDLGHQNGQEYLIFADRYSGWPMVKPLKKLDTETVIAVLDDWFLDLDFLVLVRRSRTTDDGNGQMRWHSRQLMTTFSIPN